jgi:hypothetical protein
LAVLQGNKFAKSGMFEMGYQFSAIPFPHGTSIQLDGHPGRPDIGPLQRRVLITVPGRMSLVVSIQPTISGGGLPRGASVPQEAIPNCRMFTYAVRFEAEIVRAGIHDDDIQEYKDWIEWLAGELESRNSD